MKLHYPLIVEGEEGNYSGYFPDLPGCTTGGSTLHEVRENAREALTLYLEGFTERGNPFPTPSQAVRMELIEIDEAELPPTKALAGRG
ncbi:MAG: type II toxin-antitoxin system HicB family antitoxin [Candidatus Lambdaproteobacteria bacterium]|nr:type II toxin-antitoxin system HicB family antitoxin [Candidatus Lambdaproteobacteria bacterium]